MNNEPVAWMYEDASGTMKMLGNTRLEEWVTKFGCKEIPLYTHPAKTLDEQFKKGFEAGKEEGWKAHKFHHPSKDLTDEEIGQIWKDCMESPYMQISNPVGFARAILKKASEK